MSLFRTKPIDVNADTGLKRCLGAFDLTMLGIGCIIGTGIFVLTGVVAAQHSGPAIVLSFILSGTACAFAALCYAELAGALGGARRPSRAALSPRWGIIPPDHRPGFGFSILH